MQPLPLSPSLESWQRTISQWQVLHHHVHPCHSRHHGTLYTESCLSLQIGKSYCYHINSSRWLTSIDKSQHFSIKSLNKTLHVRFQPLLSKSPNKIQRHFIQGGCLCWLRSRRFCSEQDSKISANNTIEMYSLAFFNIFKHRLVI